MSDAFKPYAKQLEADIEAYLESGNKDMSTKCLIAQDILRHVRSMPREGMKHWDETAKCRTHDILSYCKKALEIQQSLVEGHGSLITHCTGNKQLSREVI